MHDSHRKGYESTAGLVVHLARQQQFVHLLGIYTRVIGYCSCIPYLAPPLVTPSHPTHPSHFHPPPHSALPSHYRLKWSLRKSRNLSTKRTNRALQLPTLSVILSQNDLPSPRESAFSSSIAVPISENAHHNTGGGLATQPHHSDTFPTLPTAKVAWEVTTDADTCVTDGDESGDVGDAIESQHSIVAPLPLIGLAI